MTNLFISNGFLKRGARCKKNGRHFLVFRNKAPSDLYKKVVVLGSHFFSILKPSDLLKKDHCLTGAIFCVPKQSDL